MPTAAPLLRRERELARRDEALLVRECEVDAVLERPERCVDAGEADDGVQHDVGLRPLEQLGQVAADLLERRVDVVERCRAARRGAELEPGCASMISIAWRPIEPVAPSRATRFIGGPV